MCLSRCRLSYSCWLWLLERIVRKYCSERYLRWIIAPNCDPHPKVVSFSRPALFIVFCYRHFDCNHPSLQLFAMLTSLTLVARPIQYFRTCLLSAFKECPFKLNRHTELIREGKVKDLGNVPQTTEAELTTCIEELTALHTRPSSLKVLLSNFYAADEMELEVEMRVEDMIKEIWRIGARVRLGCLLLGTGGLLVPLRA
jgi:hypothetical protein